ncbi:hypothetical protein DFJ73DRAFT_957040 [Zopfochytrium polystomum]|nr:hypothetical protein DFJ73DRAFT_957040 [Zopfochytrium polystomum]
MSSQQPPVIVRGQGGFPPPVFVPGTGSPATLSALLSDYLKADACGSAETDGDTPQPNFLPYLREFSVCADGGCDANGDGNAHTGSLNLIASSSFSSLDSRKMGGGAQPRQVGVQEWGSRLRRSKSAEKGSLAVGPSAIMAPPMPRPQVPQNPYHHQLFQTQLLHPHHQQEGVHPLATVRQPLPLEAVPVPYNAPPPIQRRQQQQQQPRSKSFAAAPHGRDKEKTKKLTAN